MPPKKLKDLAEAPVYKMTHEEQVQLLSDALLREYMHRRGFRATLKAFDEEHPRDDNTISSRAVMSDLMALQQDDQQRMKADGIETIMEMLCNLRVERRVEVEKLTTEVQVPLPKVPANYDTLEAKLADRAERQKKQKRHKRGKMSSSSFENEATAVGGGEKKKKKAMSRPPRSGSHNTGATDPGAGITIDDLLGSSHSSSSSADRRTDNDRKGSDDDNNDNKQFSGSTAKAVAPQTGAYRGSNEDTKPTVASVQPAWMELERKTSTNNVNDSNCVGNEGEDGVEDEEADSLGGNRLSYELRGELSAAFQLLCGFDGSLPPALLEQGFTFDKDLDCALIQWRPGGCDAVVAPIQAFVAAYFYEREVYVKKEQRQKDCLLRSLSTVLEQAQPNASKIVLIDGEWKLKGGQTRFARSDLCQQAGAARARCWAQLSSAEELREVLRSTLLDEDRWMKPRGCGLFNFLLSLILSRGVDVVQKELEAAPASSYGAGNERPLLLSTTDGHATVALANLVLSGRATSYCHNGMQHGNQMGYPTKLKCGMLLGDAPAQADADARLPSSSYTNAMDPVMPSWVLVHKNHYANLYMTKDTRQVFQQKLNLGGSASEDVVYWDAATEDDLYTLTVTVRSITFGVGSSVRNAKSFVNTAITSVPVWSSAEVNWNGDAPLRD